MAVKPGDEPTPVGPAHHDNSEGRLTRIMGGSLGTQFTDAAPKGGVLIGFEVGLGKQGDNDVVHAIRPIFRAGSGQEILGEQHGKDTSRLVVVKAKKGYAVGAITAKSMAMLDGFSVTFMKVAKKRSGSPGPLPERLGGRQGWRTSDRSRRRRHAGDRHRRPRKRQRLHRNGAIAETVSQGSKPKQRRLTSLPLSPPLKLVAFAQACCYITSCSPSAS